MARASRRKSRGDLVDNYKITHGCQECGYRKCAPALEFHHRDSDDKLSGVGQLVSECRPVETILAEMEKCDVLCANCHRELHARVV